FENDVVLDPFLGSGTTSWVAKKLERNSIGYEISPEFLPLIEEKLDIRQKMILDDFDCEIIHQNKANIDYREAIKQLPYIFKDPVEFDKKVDPRKLQFGSKINNHNSKREKYYRVKNVISPERLIIGDGLKVRLLGIRKKPHKTHQAIEFLRDKTRGQKVFMKFDTIKYDESNNLLCYMYLQNKTFLNAHLIKQGLVDVDTSLDYKFKDRFLTTAGSN
ncbi:MAG: site-specific DNA-methyltransferase, partial [Planctomycetota bacterium]